MLKKLKKQDSGFTIIEVMIVLAIAGLIILIVLLAVPALQRNARNTAIKNDASAIVAAVGEFKSNNDGLSPSGNAVLSSNGVVTITSATGTPTKATAKVQSGTDVQGTTTPPGNPWPTGAANLIYVIYDHKCKGSNFSDGLGTDGRADAVIYPVEMSTGNPVGKCIDS